MDDLPQVDFRRRKNSRDHDETYAKYRHIKIDYLKCYFSNQYFDKTVEPNVSSPVPYYPQAVEFHVSRLHHVTNFRGLHGILQCNGFRGGYRTGILCWGLEIDDDEISNAEERYLEQLFPDRSPQEIEGQEPFLRHFTTSPEFLEKSRFGNFRFSLSLADVLQAYSTQFCRGQNPILTVYETVIYKQEVMYVVLVHSPNVHDYDNYPVLGDNAEGVCAYRDGEIIWRAQAISETHKFRLIENRYIRQVEAENTYNFEWYVWDHVTLHFHLPKQKILKFSHKKLLRALSACDAARPHLNIPEMHRAAAEEKVQNLKKYI